MGGLVATRYIAKYGDAKVKKLITLGTPYLGAPKFLNALYTGNLLTNGSNSKYGNEAIEDEIGDNQLHNYIRKLAFNMSTGYELLPTKDYFLYGYYYAQYSSAINWLDMHYNQTKLKEYEDTVNFLKNTSYNADYVNGYLVDNAIDFHNRLDIFHTLSSIKSKLYMIVGDDEPTIGMVKPRFTRNLLNNFDLVNVDSDPTSGDGTVPLQSSTLGGLFSDRTYFISETHSNLPGNWNVWYATTTFLNDDPGDDNKTSDGRQILRRTFENTRKIKLKIECPVDLNIYDNQGNHVGLSSTGVDEQIDGSSFYLSGDMKYAFLRDGNYNVKLLGTGNGTMTYTLQLFDANDQVAKTVRFDNVPITPSTVITSNTDMNSNIELLLDANGDGAVDQHVQPSIQLNAVQSQDDVAPSLSYSLAGANGDNGWFTSDVSVSVEANDTNSGVASILYNLNDAADQPFSNSLTVNQEGDNRLELFAVDQNRNASLPVGVSIKIDKTAPTPPVLTTTAPAWIRGHATLTLVDGTDATSGVYRSQYKIGDNGGWTDYISQVTVSNEGITTVYGRTIDNAGNMSSETRTVIYIDNTMPTPPSIHLSNSAWSNADVTFSIAAGSDNGSGVQKVQYKIGENGIWTDYASNVVITSEGSTDIFARTVDQVGNVSEEAHETIRIDRTSPSMPFITLSTSNWTNGVVTLHLSGGADDLSGIQKYQYRVGSQGQWTDFTSMVTLSQEGMTNIYARSIDSAGNISIDTSAEVRIDKTNPSAPSVVPSTSNWTNQDVAVEVQDGADALSGAFKSQYKIGSSGEWLDYVSPVTISNEGETTVYARTMDQAGNMGMESSGVVKIDKTPPQPAVIRSATPEIGGRWASSYWLRWSSSDNVGISKYAVYAGNELVGTTSQEFFQLTNLAARSVYTYKIIVEDISGNMSAPSDPIAIHTTVADVSANDSASFAVFPANGQIVGWGANTYGQLGDGTVSPRSTYITANGLSSMEAVKSGSRHTVALRNDDTVWTWGSNAYGQLGNGTTTDSLTPLQVTSLSGIQMVAAGGGHTVALKNDGTVWAWGYNNLGSLGNGRTTPSLVPVQSSISGVSAIAAGNAHTLALKNDGTVWAWGLNTYGELGDGTTTNRTTPVQVASLGNVVRIYTKSDTSFAIKADGTVWAWGSNNYAQVGDGTKANRLVPVQISISNVASIAPGTAHTLAVKNDGTVWAWGYNNYGQLGNGTTTDAWTPVQVSGLSGVTSAAAAGQDGHSVALKSDGTLWSWGYNNTGQLGDGTLTNRWTPVQVKENAAPGITVVWPTGTQASPSTATTSKPTITWSLSDAEGTVFTGYQVQVLDAAGTVVVDSGSVAQSTTATTGSWVVSTALANNQIYQVKVRQKDSLVWSDWTAAGWLRTAATITGGPSVSAGSGFSIAVKSNATLQAWGIDGKGQLGDGLTNAESTGVAVAALSGVASGQAGDAHSVALKTDGTVWTWGDNTYGQLGNGTTTGALTPMQVTSLSGIQMVAAGGFHTVALKNDGTVWAWGYNASGALGNGRTTQSLLPVQASISGVSAIAAGSAHTVALKNDGTVWAWGRNTYGELGDGTTTNRTTPVQVANLSNVARIYTKGDTSFAIKTDGTVWAWGSNNYAQVGDGTRANRLVPVQISISNVASIASGSAHTLAVKNDGTVWAWGYNNYGQLGNGTTTDAYTPIMVSGLSGVTSAAAGQDGHSIALKSDGTMWSWGYNNTGQLGDGTLTNRLTPVQVKENAAPVITVVWPTGTQASPAAATTSKPTITWSLSDAEGTVFTGYQVQVLDAAGAVVIDSGIVAQSTTATTGSWVVSTALASNQTYQVKVRQKDSLVWSDWTTAGWLRTASATTSGPSISAGNGFSIAVKSDATLQGWGIDGKGQLGDGSTSTKSTGVAVSALSAVASGQAGDSHSVALKADGTVWTWGDNTYGQLGNGTKVRVLTPVQVTSLSGIQMVAAGGFHTVALKNDGTVWAWGYNGSGALGNGRTTQSLLPVKASISGVSAIAAGNTYTLALKNDGTVWAWGMNTYGELGDGTSTNRTTPVQVANLSNVVRIYAKSDTSFAIKADGTVWAWGSNNYAQVGDGTKANRFVPVPINLSNVTSIAPGTAHTLAVKNDGTVWAWGLNNYGQLGNGTTTDAYTPIMVSGLSGVTGAAAGQDGHSVALKSDGTMWSWGYNNTGQLGDGTLTNRLTPVQVK